MGKISVSMTEKEIWDVLMKEFNNAYGVAGLMGNIKAESNLRSTNLQQTYEKKLGFTDDTYTEAVDNGTYDNFVKDSAGYGLVQWTWWSRKESLLNYANSIGHSIGSCRMQVDFMIDELKKYNIVYATLKNATSVREASDVVLMQYERPADQGEAMQIRRANYGNEFYNKYANSEPIVTPSVEEEGKKNVLYKVQIGAYSIKSNAEEQLEKAKKAGFSDAFICEVEVEDEGPNIPVEPTPLPFESYMVRIYVDKLDNNCLNIMESPSEDSNLIGTVTEDMSVTIVEESKDAKGNIWGLLLGYSKYRNGWIRIDYTEKIK
jgi:hypothetical protein